VEGRAFWTVWSPGPEGKASLAPDSMQSNFVPDSHRRWLGSAQGTRGVQKGGSTGPMHLEPSFLAHPPHTLPSVQYWSPFVFRVDPIFKFPLESFTAER
jgi:hypothetical protein